MRSLEPDDSDLLRDLFDRMGRVSRRRRFLIDKRELSAADLRQLTSVDHRHHEAIVALSASDGRPVGVVRFVRSDEDVETAEAAVVVVDSWQGRGLGTVLASELVARARELQVRRFAMVVADDNAATFRLVDRMLGKVQRMSVGGGAAEVVGCLPQA